MYSCQNFFNMHLIKPLKYNFQFIRYTVNEGTSKTKAQRNNQITLESRPFYKKMIWSSQKKCQYLKKRSGGRSFSRLKETKKIINCNAKILTEFWSEKNNFMEQMEKFKHRLLNATRKLLLFFLGVGNGTVVLWKISIFFFFFF